MADCLPDTQTPNTLTVTPCSQITGTEKLKAVWGRLFSTYIHLEPVDLDKVSFTIGRAQDCDVIITQKTFPLNRCQNVSKLHFLITKEPGSPPYITDLSKNGTFLNGHLIGKGKKNILQNDDEISIGFQSLKVYVFKSVVTKENQYLPAELRNKYEPSRLLGKGACGEVRLVFDKISCKPFAVKKITKARNSSFHRMNHVSKIKSEVKILKSLSHPCIVSVQEIVENDEAVFIVLEYMEGGELSDYILSATALTESQVKFLFYQILLAVQYLHTQGVTHRDLKPENVLLKTGKPDSLLKITDFGLSKIISDETMMRTVCGTPCYVAPEVLDRKFTSYDQQVDVWSLGVILFYMLSQELPFNGEDKTVLSKAILQGNYKFSSDSWSCVSNNAKDLVSKMLTLNPEKRIRIDDIIGHPWISKDNHVKSKVQNLIYEEQETVLIGELDFDLTSLAPPKRRKTGLDSVDSCIRSSLNRNLSNLVET